MQWATGYDIFLPVVWLLVAAGVILLIDLFTEESERQTMPVFFTALGGVLLSFVSLNPYWDARPVVLMRGAMIVDQFAVYLITAILTGTAISMFASISYVRRIGISLTDFLCTLLLAASGMVLLTVSNDLIMVFLSVELLSFAVYVLTGLNGRSSKGAEGAMKYFVMGGLASAVMVLGMAALYGVTGEVALRPLGDKLAQLYSQPDGSQYLATLGMGAILIAFAFKVGAVPFHSWVPDAYEGAPTTVTGFMAVAVKAAAFGALIRVAVAVFPEHAGPTGFAGDFGWATYALWFLSALSMILGNWFAISQRNVKRMLAYSSIAHSGYLLMGLASSGGRTEAYAAILFYLLTYTLMTSGAFAMLVYASSGGKDVEDIEDLRGLAWKKPAVGICLAIFMFSMAGIPLTGGFMGKYFVFSQAVYAGGPYLSLAIIGICTSIIGAYYYLRVVAVTYFREADDRPVHGREDWGIKFALSVTVFGTVALGVFPQIFYDGAKASVEQLRVEAPAVEGRNGQTSQLVDR
ncbi:MAG: NAD(P)H-quinone oxidoreductase subunit 2, chloroplastic [Planctomycetes bacterium]|nr:NAD(P)H-quinone oxidoreductase subunit 2, chloroplastic [Planctomycetota bacterium]HRJ78890.1 NADH-quinone oxidoreductase subunit N [Planctomycetota bacterium]